MDVLGDPMSCWDTIMGKILWGNTATIWPQKRQPFQISMSFLYNGHRGNAVVGNGHQNEVTWHTLAFMPGALPSGANITNTTRQCGCHALDGD